MVLLLVVASWLVSVATVCAQGLPTEPVSLGDGRVVVSAEVSATFAEDDPGFFNYTDYEYSAVRNFRVGVGVEVRASRWLQVLSEVRVDHGDHVEPYALYARVRPWPSRRFDIQAGRIPPTFGAFGRGSYGSANLLIGTPLAYQYLTSLRADALPATADDLLAMRGRGWLSSFPLGNTRAHRGLPLINSIRSDTGVQVHGVNGMVEWIGAITTGSLSNPRDDNGGRNLAGRVIVRPLAPLAVGVSAARGAYLSRALEDVVGDDRLEDGVQRALGVDAEYSIGRFLARGEVIHARWTLPLPLSDSSTDALGVTAALIEARYRIYPGVQLAARLERLGFSRLDLEGRQPTWEAPARRLEIGGGYSFTRNVMLKVSWQRNARAYGRIERDSLGAMQVIYWF